MQETTRTRTSTKTHAAAEENSFPCSSQTVNQESDWEFATGGQKEDRMKILLVWNTSLSPEIPQEQLDHATAPV